MANWLQQKKLESVYGRAKTTDSEHAMSQKMLILVDGKLDIFTAKTAVSLIRYRPGEVVAVLDRAHAGQDLEAIVGSPR